MIEKRHGWSLHVPPSPPPRPQPPREKTITYTRKWVHTAYESCYVGDIKIPEGYSYADLYVETCQNYGDLSMEFYIINRAESDNPTYQHELKRWEENHSKWAAEDKEYHEELKQWTLWKQQQQSMELEKDLKKAEELLRRHGRLGE